MNKKIFSKKCIVIFLIAILLFFVIVSSTIVFLNLKSDPIVIKKKLSDDVSERNLGLLNKKPNEENILQKVSELNPELITEEVEVKDIDLHGPNDKNIKIGSAKIYVKTNSNFYTGESVDISFEIIDRVDLKDVIRNIELGEIQSNEEENILQKVSELNPELITEEVEVKDIDLHGPNDKNIKIGSAKIYVKTNSNFYTGESVDISFEIIDRVDLKDVIRNIELGEIQSNEEENILQKVSELNPELITEEVEVKDIDLHGPNDKNIKIGSAKIYVKTNSNFYTGESVDISFEIIDRVDLKDVIRNIELGEIQSNEEENILQKVSELNPELITEEVEVKDIDLHGPNDKNIKIGSAKIYVKTNSNFYTGESVDISFEIIDRVDLKDVIRNIELGEIQSNEEENILQKVSELNPKLKTDQLEIDNSTEIAATIKPKANSTWYKGENIINYQTKKVNLSKNDLNNITSAVLSSQVFNDELYLGTFGQGMWKIGTNNNVSQIPETKQPQTIRNMYVDQTNNMWYSYQNSENNNKLIGNIKKYNNDKINYQTDGVMFASIEYNGRLFFGGGTDNFSSWSSDKGYIYWSDNYKEESPTWNKMEVKETIGTIFTMQIFKNKLYLAGYRTLLVIDNNFEIKKINNYNYTDAFRASIVWNNELYIAGNGKLLRITDNEENIDMLNLKDWNSQNISAQIWSINSFKGYLYIGMYAADQLNEGKFPNKNSIVRLSYKEIIKNCDQQSSGKIVNNLETEDLNPNNQNGWVRSSIIYKNDLYFFFDGGNEIKRYVKFSYQI
ncbi:hypothetical protein [Mesoplasma florum]|uniref:hypothetical protein n=1 Tax=Mesoplasma florum TaxID=2151 RepID=UPI000BE25229|nr:hypothetical protein [Mesoplasma florum]ATI74143.1 hypothetical protein CQZ70_02710 [Mesoplasma florum]